MKPQKIEIDFNTTAGNFYIKDALGFGYPFLDPNSDFGKAVVERYNSYEEMQQRIAQLEEALKVLYEVALSCNGHIYLKDKQINELKILLHGKHL